MTLSFRLSSLLLALAIFFVPLTARADDSPVRKVTVIGNATIKVVPDQMKWTVAIRVSDATVAKAKERHDASLAQALAFLKSLGTAVQDLQTGGLTIDKENYFPPNADKSKPYSCATQITFTLTDFEKYGTIADSLAKLDGCQLQGTSYASSKEDETKRDALKQALVNAHDKANDLATTAGLKIDKPLVIQEGIVGDGPQPVMMMRAMAPGNGGGTPDAVAGQIEISATITATYDLLTQ